MADTQTFPLTIPVHYLKGSHFRVIHVDGAYGGLTNRGLIQVALYSERNALPTETAVTIVSMDQPAVEDVVAKREGVVRELEASLMMDLNTAEALQRWLAAKVEELRAVLNPTNV